MTRTAQLVVELILALAVAGVLTRKRAWQRVGYRRLTTARDLRFYWIPLFPILPVLPAALAALLGTALADLAPLVALAALVGFVEETVFRGLLLRWLAPRGLWWAAVVSSVVFGVLHLVNVPLGARLDVTLVQVGMRRRSASPSRRWPCGPGCCGCSFSSTRRWISRDS